MFRILVVAILYFVFARIGLSLSIAATNVSPVWPAAGIALASMLLFGFRIWPAIMLGAFIANYLVGSSLIDSFLISTGNTLEACLGFYLLNRYANGPNFLQRVEDVLKFVLLAGFVSTVASASIGTASLFLTESNDRIPLTYLWSTWWLGDMMGNLLIVPAVMAWRKRETHETKASEIADAIVVFASIVAVTVLVFNGNFEVGIPLVYLTVPLFICAAAFRFGQKGATLAILIVSTIAILGTTQGEGPFDRPNLNESLLLLQVFIGSIQLTALILGASLIERKSGEAVLRESEAKSRSLVERVPAIVYQVEFGETLSWRYVSPRIKSILGFTAEEWTSDSQLWSRHVHPDDREEVLSKGMRSSLSGKPFVCEYRMFGRDGNIVWFRDEGNVIRDKGRKTVFIQGIMLDITERKRAELLQAILHRLAEKTSVTQNMEQFYAVVHENISELIDARNFYIALYDPSTQTFSFPYISSEKTDTLDLRRAANALNFYVLSNGALLADAEKIRELVKSGVIPEEETSYLSWLGVPLKSGENTLGVIAVQSYLEEKKFLPADLNALVLVSDEVATTLEQKRAEKALQVKSAQLQSINQAMTMFLETNSWKSASHLILQSALRETGSEYGFIGIVTDESTLRVLAHEGIVWDADVNREFYEEAQRTYAEKGYLEFPNLKNLFGSVITQASPVISNDPLRDPRSAGSLPKGHPPLNCFLGVPFHYANQVIGMIGVANRPNGYTSTDLEKLDYLSQTTCVLYQSYLQAQKQEALQEELRQSHKMEAIGRLAGGVAHDFNNLLMAITGYCELVLMRLSTNPLNREMNEILKAAEQGAALTRQLLAFGRKQILMPRVIHLDKVVRNMEDLLRRLLGEDIELMIVSQNNLGNVKADPGQIEQVIMNLAVNARDAMPDGGKLFLQTFNVTVRIDDTRKPVGVSAGTYVLLRVQDTGQGMDEDTLKRVFEPFFTTKQTGKGTGLGLATVYGIVKQSSGYVNVESKRGSGTTFDIYLPQVDEPLEMPAITAGSRPDSSELLRMILLVDDNEAVRRATSALLQARGFAVLEASNGQEAVIIAEQHPGAIDLLITDVVMPRMGGANLAEAILEKRPNTKILFMSGYSEESVLGRNPSATFLQKPFSLGTFLERISELLDYPDKAI
ncbi:MASE1 domain-containing protein [bacterium]|nr:MASE1 domain-containing protein [bacterium]